MPKAFHGKGLAQRASAIGQSVVNFLAALDDAQQLATRIRRVAPEQQARVARQWLQSRQD